MMRLFKWFDALLLAAAQKFCDKFQQFTGLTKFRLEKWAMILSTVSVWLAVFAIDLRLSLILLALAYTIGSAPLVRLADKTEALFLVFLANGRSIPPQYNTYTALLFQRLFTICMYGVIWVPSLFLSGTAWPSLFCQGVSYMAWMYFTACVPRPPGESKVREWYEKTLTWLDSKYAPLP